MTEFLVYLDREAAARIAARRARKPALPPCKMCKGSGSVTRYVLPGITGPDKCKSCNGTGDAPAPPTAEQGPAIQVHCPDCGAVPGNRCRNKRYVSPVPLGPWYFVRPHAARQRAAREVFGDGVDT
jgi:hypothetical protein